MIDRIHIDRRNEAYILDIDVHLEPRKAADILKLVEEDAGEAEVTLGAERRLRHLIATGLVTPPTMRSILNVLAA